MEQVFASRSVSITELKRSPSAVFEQAGSEPVAVLNHNRPAGYLLSPRVCEAMPIRLNADLRQSIQKGIDSGPAVAAEQLFDELNARYVDHGSKPTTRPRGKRQA